MERVRSVCPRHLFVLHNQRSRFDPATLRFILLCSQILRASSERVKRPIWLKITCHFQSHDLKGELLYSHSLTISHIVNSDKELWKVICKRKRYTPSLLTMIWIDHHHQILVKHCYWQNTGYLVRAISSYHWTWWWMYIPKVTENLILFSVSNFCDVFLTFSHFNHVKNLSHF